MKCILDIAVLEEAVNIFQKKQLQYRYKMWETMDDGTSERAILDITCD
jgi:hypothetical protein